MMQAFTVWNAYPTARKNACVNLYSQATIVASLDIKRDTTNSQSRLANKKTSFTSHPVFHWPTGFAI